MSRPLRYLSLFSGIEAATTAWASLQWECAAVSEIDPHGCAHLAQRHPDVLNLGDVTKITENDIMMLGEVDLVVFGSPCQDLSVAGKRKGLDGARSGLFFTAMQIVQWARVWGGCRFALWENVPGAFTSNTGRDFAAVVDAMACLADATVPPKGWGNEGCAVGAEAMVEWATLDAQWFGVAQRRRRVFALADFGDWRRRPPILLEPQGLRGDSAPSRGAREGVAAGTLRSSDGGCDVDHARAGHLIPERRPVLTAPGVPPIAMCLNAGGMGRLDAESETLLAFDITQITSAANRSNPQPGDPCHPLVADVHPPAICFTGDITHALNTANNGKGSSEDGTGRGVPTIAFHHNAQACQLSGVDRDTSVADALTCSQGVAVAKGMVVRRLTPRECERLQGFPDDHTLITARGKPAADGPRYKALGNSMAVPVMRWIGEQIDFVHSHF